MAQRIKHSINIDYLSLLINSKVSRQYLQVQLAVSPPDLQAKIREALAIHSVIIAGQKLVELKKE